MKKILEVLGWILIAIVVYYVVQVGLVIGGVSHGDAPGMALFGMGVIGLWIILDKPFGKKGN